MSVRLQILDKGDGLIHGNLLFVTANHDPGFIRIRSICIKNIFRCLIQSGILPGSILILLFEVIPETSRIILRFHMATVCYHVLICACLIGIVAGLPVSGSIMKFRPAVQDSLILCLILHCAGHNIQCGFLCFGLGVGILKVFLICNDHTDQKLRRIQLQADVLSADAAEQCTVYIHSLCSLRICSCPG